MLSHQTIRIWWVLILFPAIIHLCAEEKLPVPQNAKVTLSCDREEYFLGENILVHFKLENTGGAAFNANFGHDYRGAARALRFKVTATDQNGESVADPYPSSMCMGGLGDTREITPNKPFYHSVPIVRYLRFEKAGTYVIKIHHDCGWQESAERGFPEGKIVLHLKSPTKEQARELVQSWLAERPYQGSTWGEKSNPHADFSQIRFGEYLAPLSDEAKKGNENALVGVGSIATPEATRLLIEVAKTKNGPIRKIACPQLCMRLPDPFLTGELGKRNIFEDGREEPRRWLVENSWRKEFSTDVRKLASELLRDPDKDWVATGAYMMECVGTKSDAPLIVAALKREVKNTLSYELRTDIYPRPRGACIELQRAAKMMLKRGVSAPENPTSPGESILFLIALQDNAAFRPEGWMQTCDRLLQNDIPYIQENTLKAVPAPMPRLLQKHLAPILKSGDIDASIEACRIIERDKLTDLKEPILAVLRTATEDWLFRAASSAALAIDAKYERIEILVGRLDEPDMMFKCLDALKTIFTNTGGGSANSNIDIPAAARRIKPKWQTFIKENKAYLESGETFNLPHHKVTADMFPEGYYMSLKDGTHWPKPDNWK